VYACQREGRRALTLKRDLVVPANGLTLDKEVTSIEIVQKLFSMFPAGAPGIALLLLRLSVAAMLFIDPVGRVSWPALTWLAVMSLVAAIALVAGFLTPILALICGALKIYALIGAAHGIAPLLVLALLLSFAVAMLGPGAYSLDAKMFGRRVVLLPPQR
jgi:uncharacterized membrane protein YphA (DoxX/SURF4 family)